jgi:hypothetical protein
MKQLTIFDIISKYKNPPHQKGKDRLERTLDRWGKALADNANKPQKAVK